MKKIIFLTTLCLLAVLGLSACSTTPAEKATDDEKSDPVTPAATDAHIVTDGASDYKIVIAETATQPYKNAASELQKYIKLATGAELPIITDAEAKTDKEIRIGQTNRGYIDNADTLGTDGYRIVLSGDAVLIAGAPRGAIYGAYGFIKTFLNARFYPENIEIVPETTTLTVKAGTDITDKPVFDSRTCYWDFYDSENDAQNMKLGMSPCTSDWGNDNVAANNFDMHTINYLLNNNEDAKYHTYCQQPCLTDEDNYNKILSSALEWIARRNGTCTYINISQNDGDGGWCTCEACTALNNEYGGGKPTGSWWYFINRITKDIHEKYPDVEVRTYAYADTADLPTIDIDPTVCAYVSTSNGGVCSNHAIEECDFNKEALKDSDLRVWSKKVGKIYVFEYYGCSGEFTMTFDNLYAMKTNYQMFAECGVFGIVPFGTATVAADFVTLRYYLMTKLMWNPNVTDEEYQSWIDDFCAVYYGEASGQYITEFIKLFHETFKDRDCVVEYGFHIEKVYNFDTIANADDYKYPDNVAELVEANDMATLVNLSRVISTDYFDKAHALFDKALEGVTDEELYRRIKLASLQVDYHELYLFNAKMSSISNYVREINSRYGTNLRTGIVVSELKTNMAETLIADLIACGVNDLREGASFDNGKTPDPEKTPYNWVK